MGDPEHAFFHCARFTGERKSIEEILGKVIASENLIEEMFVCQENWNAVNHMVERIEKIRGNKASQEDKIR